MQRLKQLIAKIMTVPLIRFIVTVGQRFGRDNGGIYAGALSFFMLLAFVPMMLTGVAILAAFIRPDDALRIVQNMVHNLIPAGGASAEMTHLINDRLHPDQIVAELKAKHGIAGILGFLSLVWASMQIFVNASAAMNDAWEVKETRNWFLLRGIALGLMAAAGVLVTITLLLSGAPNAVAHFNLPIIHHLPLPMWVFTVVFEVLAVVVNGVLYLLIFKFLPNARVPWKAAVIGGLTASIGWEIAKKGIAVWLLRPNHSIYGDLADLILFVLWIYYSMMILLIGAEVSAVYAKQETAPVRGGAKASSLAHAPAGKSRAGGDGRIRKPSGRTARARR